MDLMCNHYLYFSSIASDNYYYLSFFISNKAGSFSLRYVLDKVIIIVPAIFIIDNQNLMQGLELNRVGMMRHFNYFDL